MDVQAMRQIIFDKMNMKVGEDDPFFALILMNETLLAEALGQQAAALAPVVEELQKQSQAIRAALDHALVRVEESRAAALKAVEGSAQREAAGVRESVREAAFKAGVDGAAQAFEQFSKKRMGELDGSIKGALTSLGEIQKAYRDMLAKTAEASGQAAPKDTGSGGKWLRAAFAAVLGALLVLGGQWLLAQQSGTQAHASAVDAQWRQAVTNVWPRLPDQVKTELNAAFNRAAN
jgi:hypothetical protein